MFLSSSAVVYCAALKTTSVPSLVGVFVFGLVLWVFVSVSIILDCPGGCEAHACETFISQYSSSEGCSDLHRAAAGEVLG